MQSKLAAWSTGDKHRRFDRLLRVIATPSWLQEAARITLASKGARAAGVDGITGDMLSDQLDNELAGIRVQLLAGTYQPRPARRIYIPKANGKQRPLGIPTLRDRIVQRAMLMAMDPIWESDFHRLSYGFRLGRSVHHAIRTVKLQLQDSQYTKGRWVIEGDLSSYFDTVHHKVLMRCVRKRICDKRFLSLLWRFIKSGHVDRGLFCAASKGVPQGGVLSPLLSNIVLNEFDQWLDRDYLCSKARKDRWSWNDTIKRKRPIAIREDRQWKPAVSYCRYADDFVIIVKGNKRHAELIRERCRKVLEEDLKLTLNMEKTHITHINDGITFLGHRIIRKRGANGTMRPVTTIPRAKFRNFSHELVQELSGDYSMNKIDLVEHLNRKIAGWVAFYRFTDYTARYYDRIDSVVFWKLGYWLCRKYKTSMKSQMRQWVKRPVPDQAKTWYLFGKDTAGRHRAVALRRMVGSRKDRFSWRNPAGNPYLVGVLQKNAFTSRYYDVAMAMGHA